jgi:hypothetical protein
MQNAEYLLSPRIPTNCVNSQAFLAIQASEGRAHFELAYKRFNESRFVVEPKKSGLIANSMVHLRTSLEAINDTRSAIGAHERSMASHGKTKEGLVKAIDLHRRGVTFHAGEIVEYGQWNTLSELTQRTGYASALQEVEKKVLALETMTLRLIESTDVSLVDYPALTIQYMRLTEKWNVFQGLTTAVCLISSEMFSPTVP